MPRTQTDARSRILEVADALFYREGVRAVGVDTIIAEADVAKTTLYRYFPSKDDLVVAYLEERSQRFWQLFETVVVAPYSDQPRQQLFALLGWLDELLAQPEIHGCPFLITASEFPDTHYPGHQVALTYKQTLRDRITALAEQANLQPAPELSAALMMLIDGAFAQRRLFQTHPNGITLVQAAQRLIAAY
ncbi:MAG: TetR/AcrR family transcriptional regulator [Elainella sp.]